MLRAIIGAGIGIAIGLFALAAWGASYGYENGLPSARVPPGVDGAIRQAFVVTVFLGWMAVIVGGPLGALIGYAFKPRRQTRG